MLAVNTLSGSYLPLLTTSTMLIVLFIPDILIFYSQNIPQSFCIRVFAHAFYLEYSFPNLHLIGSLSFRLQLSFLKRSQINSVNTLQYSDINVLVFFLIELNSLFFPLECKFFESNDTFTHFSQYYFRFSLNLLFLSACLQTQEGRVNVGIQITTLKLKSQLVWGKVILLKGICQESHADCNVKFHFVNITLLRS